MEPVKQVSLEIKLNLQHILLDAGSWVCENPSEGHPKTTIGVDLSQLLILNSRAGLVFLSESLRPSFSNSNWREFSEFFNDARKFAQKLIDIIFIVIFAQAEPQAPPGLSRAAPHGGEDMRRFQ